MDMTVSHWTRAVCPCRVADHSVDYSIKLQTCTLSRLMGPDVGFRKVDVLHPCLVLMLCKNRRFKVTYTISNHLYRKDKQK